ncbi:MAG: 23S rRNA methyltransferase [Chelatococcus sp.]|nr:MAG: 23S rRNA methyltransferase [Chelatococcus sp.]
MSSGKSGGGKAGGTGAGGAKSGGTKSGGAKSGGTKSGGAKSGGALTPGKQVAGAKPAGDRDLRVRLKNARKHKHSSQLWLERQLNDPYVKRAKERGFRSRAAFKLEEMDERYKFLKSGQRLIDLGCAPGGWCQVAAERIGLAQGKGRIVGIDLLPVDPIPGVELIEMDFMTEEAPALLVEKLGGQAAGVMSDMAGNTTGHKKTDHLRIIGLAEAALEFAHDVLAPGGFFLAKLFQGGDSAPLLAQMKRDFTLVRNVKPGASRADSSELYVLATGYRRKAVDEAGSEADA